MRRKTNIPATIAILLSITLIIYVGVLLQSNSVTQHLTGRLIQNDVVVIPELCEELAGVIEGGEDDFNGICYTAGRLSSLNNAKLLNDGYKELIESAAGAAVKYASEPTEENGKAAVLRLENLSAATEYIMTLLYDKDTEKTYGNYFDARTKTDARNKKITAFIDKLPGKK